MNSKVGLVVTLEAKPGREEELAALLISGQDLVKQEPDTQSWFAFRSGQTSFGIVDTFGTAEGRTAHLQGRLASILLSKAPELLAKGPTIREVDLIAETPRR